MTNPDREELVKIADEARSAAIGAISHVSLANYAEREREAKQWVRNTFDKLDDALRRLASSEDAVKGEPVALSASERACYLWPDDTEQARACRAAYIDGAKDYTAPTADAGMRKALANLLAYTERNECPHESTSRGGAIWTICDDCGRKWADDQGGFKPYAEPAEITAARAALTAPGATTKSDGTPERFVDSAYQIAEELRKEDCPSDPSSTRSGVTALADIAKERQRQREVEGWSLAHDDAHDAGEMASAAACYALSATGLRGDDGAMLRFWPWDDHWWKPSNRRRDLIKAGALIVAEIERLDRLDQFEIRRK